MRIGFDVSVLHRPHPPGLVRVVSEVVGALERRAKIEVVRLAPAEGQGLRSWRQRELPRRARELDGIHSFVSSFALLGPGLRVQTIHELPWKHGESENAGITHRLWNAIGPLRADAIVTATEFTARDIRSRLLPGRRKVRVIPWGVGPDFHPSSSLVSGTTPRAKSAPQAPSNDTTRGSRASDGATGQDVVPMLFCPGAARAKKGLDALVDGVARQTARPRIVVTGPTTEFFRAQHDRARSLGVVVFNAEQLDAAQMLELYQSALAVALLSRSEGFGLPILEALACGTPVIVPQNSAQAEVAGAAGLRVDPCDPASVAGAIERATKDRERLRTLGIERAAQFTWDRTAAAIEDLWKDLVR